MIMGTARRSDPKTQVKDTAAARRRRRVPYEKSVAYLRQLPLFDDLDLAADRYTQNDHPGGK